MKELKQLARDTLWRILDNRYRDFSMMSMASFMPDEFDEKEQKLLFKLLCALRKWGYARVFGRLSHFQAGQVIIDTAAGYGEFVDTGDCVSYLGIFIAAEAVQYPFAIDSYAVPMMRSACFGKLGQDLKKEVLVLMNLARFVREIDLSSELNRDV